MTDDEFIDAHENLIPLANDLKKAWRKYHEKRAGKPYKPSKRYDGIVEWLKMAIVVDKTGATADDWVHAQFKMGKSLPFVNAARGEQAKVNYRRFMQLRTQSVWAENPEPEKVTRPVGELEIMSRILDLKYYLVANKKTDNLLDPGTRQYVLTRLPGLLDALAVILLSPDDEMWNKYGHYVRQEILETPMLLDAVKSLDMNAAWDYINEHV